LRRKNIIQRHIKTLLRQAARWTVASKQDKNPIIAMLHANYGAAYLYSMYDIASPEEIVKSGIDINKFRSEILLTQDEATKNMVKICPDVQPDKSYLTEIAGEI
jgi:hypothetical protein